MFRLSAKMFPRMAFVELPFESERISRKIENCSQIFLFGGAHVSGFFPLKEYYLGRRGKPSTWFPRRGTCRGGGQGIARSPGQSLLENRLFPNLDFPYFSTSLLYIHRILI